MAKKPTQPETKATELTADQKLQVIMLHRRSLTTQVAIRDVSKHLESLQSQQGLLDQAITNTLNGFCQELGINPADYTFDLDALTLTKNPEKPADKPAEENTTA